MTSPVRTTYPGESPAESSRAVSHPNPPRVNQVDADDLDSALVSMLSEKLGRSLDNFKSAISIGLKPELELFIKLLLFRYGIWDAVIPSSPGAKLQNLKLVSSGKQISRKILLLYLLLHPPIFPTYLITRIREHALSNQWPDLPNHDWRKKAWRVLGRVESASRIWELVGWGWFLFDGRYPSLLMRLLRLRLVPSQPHLTRLVSYEFMNRQLVWGAFTEFLMFSVPLLPPIPTYLNPSSIIAQIRALLSAPPAIDYNSLPPLSARDGTGPKAAKAHTGPYAGLPKSTCPICHVRYSSAPVPLDSSSAGAALTLPPIPVSQSGAHDAEESLIASEYVHPEEGEEESRIFVPAQSDCEGGCRWCYYCIGEELYKHREVQGRRRIENIASNKHKGKGVNASEEEVGELEKWPCLRCGGGATRAWRVGVDSG